MGANPLEFFLQWLKKTDSIEIYLNIDQELNTLKFCTSKLYFISYCSLTKLDENLIDSDTQYNTFYTTLHNVVGVDKRGHRQRRGWLAKRSKQSPICVLSNVTTIWKLGVGSPA